MIDQTPDLRKIPNKSYSHQKWPRTAGRDLHCATVWRSCCTIPHGSMTSVDTLGSYLRSFRSRGHPSQPEPSVAMTAPGAKRRNTSGPENLNTPSQNKHLLELGLEITPAERRVVRCVFYLFCMLLGCASAVEGDCQRHQRTHNTKYFQPPFWKDKYVTHLKQQCRATRTGLQWTSTLTFCV